MAANPSSWHRRFVICLLSLFGAAVSAYLAAYQLGLTGTVWDPVFHEQSRLVLHSQVSAFFRYWLLLPDAALGAIAYVADLVLCLAGSVDRWERQPWLVALFGCNLVAMAAGGALLVALQATLVGAWCLLCLTSAVTSWFLLYLSFDEIAAMVRRLDALWWRTRNSDVLWRAFAGRTGV